MILTVAQKIAIADISMYLAQKAIDDGGLFGSGIDLELPDKIYNVRESVYNRYVSNPNDETLTQTSNYLYALCGKFALAAQQVMQISGSIGGVIAGLAPTPYQFYVDTSSSFIIAGQSTKTITSFIGYNLIFVRGNITQSTVDPGGGASYYSWNKETGTFVCYPAAVETELFQLIPV